MKPFTNTLAFAALLALPATAGAQIDNSVSVTINATPFVTQGTGWSGSRGGGLEADFSVDFPDGTRSFADYLVWCIDPSRTTWAGNTSTYQLWSLADFAASTLGTFYNDPNAGDMNEIASIVSDLEDNWGSLTLTDRQNRQGQVWDRFTGMNFSPYVGDRSFDGSSWYVLYSGTYQTLLTRIPEPSQQVPEPASLALIGAGLVGVMAVRRRQRA